MSTEMSSPGLRAVDLLVCRASELLTCRPARPGGDVRGAALDRVERVRDGAVAVRDGVIAAVGPSDELLRRFHAAEVVDATGCLVTPGLVDTHTHLVHGGDRCEEWGRKVAGSPDEPLAGGVAHTSRLTAATRFEDLRAATRARLDTMLRHGTTTVETKSGYALRPSSERRLLEVVHSVQHPVDVVSTYLGAHVAPPAQADRAAFVESVIGQLEHVQHLAEYCDVCCDPVGFRPDECVKIAAAAAEHGLRLRVHADQTGHAGGAEMAVEVGAASADHLEYVSDAAIEMLARSGTAATLLPGVSFHLVDLVPRREAGRWVTPRHTGLARRYRRLVAAGALVVLASDYNPGSSPNLSMQAVMQLAARLYQIGYAEAWQMSTINAASSLGRADTIGSLEPGKKADLVVWDVPRHELVINQYGTNLVRLVVKDGAVVCRRTRDLQPVSAPREVP